VRNARHDALLLPCPATQAQAAMPGSGIFSEGRNTMAIVSIDADIKAKWRQGHCAHSPGSAEELAIIAVDLLVKELGTEGAQNFMAQAFVRYSTEALSSA
jgi:hypothetical protein